MGQGVLGWLHNNLSGDQSRQTPSPGLFAPGQVGAMWTDYLKNLYSTPTSETPQFKGAASTLRDSLAQESNAAGESTAQALNSGGAFDSGARVQALGDINRTRLQAYSKGLSELLAKLEENKMSAAFPYLQAVLGEYSAHQSAIGAAQGEQNFRGAQLGQGITSGIGIAQSGGGSSGGSSGGYTN